MDNHSQHHEPAAGPILIEIGSGRSFGPAPVLQRPVFALRSPLAEHRLAAALVDLDGDRPAVRVQIPVRPAIRAAVAALPCLVLGWQAAMVAGAVAAVIPEVDALLERTPVRFADGFIPPRGGDAWPHGVGEDNDVRWNWARGSASVTPGTVARSVGR